MDVFSKDHMDVFSKDHMDVFSKDHMDVFSKLKSKFVFRILKAKRS